MLRCLLPLCVLAVASSACAQTPPATRDGPTRADLASALVSGPIPPPRPALPPQVQVREQTRTYAVHGSSDAEILASIRAASPIRSSGVDGRALDAYTSWRIEWRYALARQGGECRFRTVTVRADLTTTLWDWTPPRDASPALVADWQDRARRLRQHEAGHTNYALLGARDVFRALRPMRAASCDALRDQADAEGQRILDLVRAANRRYDEHTQHGTVEPG